MIAHSPTTMHSGISRQKAIARECTRRIEAMIKKTLYQVLDLPANAASQDIQAAYEQQSHRLQSQAGKVTPEELTYRQQLLDVARDTLSDPVMRRDYDDRLMARPSGGALRPQSQAPGHGDGETLARRAEAMSLTTGAALTRLETPPPPPGGRWAGR